MLARSALASYPDGEYVSAPQYPNLAGTPPFDAPVHPENEGVNQVSSASPRTTVHQLSLHETRDSLDAPGERRAGGGFLVNELRSTGGALPQLAAKSSSTSTGEGTEGAARRWLAC